jgi:hypothetical protein
MYALERGAVRRLAVRGQHELKREAEQRTEPSARPRCRNQRDGGQRWDSQSKRSDSHEPERRSRSASAQGA